MYLNGSRLMKGSPSAWTEATWAGMRWETGREGHCGGDYRLGQVSRRSTFRAAPGCSVRNYNNPADASLRTTRDLGPPEGSRTRNRRARLATKAFTPSPAPFRNSPE